MTEQTLTRHRLFVAWAYEKEEQWLTKMAAQGWQLEEVGFLTHRFRKTQPQQMQYQLDYQSLTKDNRDEYLSLFEESGWEHCNTYSSLWFYFRKPKTGDQEERIHTDNASRIKMLKRVLMTLIISGFPSWMMLFYLPILMKQVETGFFPIVLQAIVIPITLILLYSSVRILTRIGALQKGLKQ